MKLAILTCGMLPIPAVQGGAVENLIDFYLAYNDKHQLHDITVYSPWNSKVVSHPAHHSTVNHYIYIDVTSFKARIARKLYGYFHHNEYYNHFIEYYFEKVYDDIKKKDFDYIIIENGAGLSYKLSQRGYKNLILHMHNEIRKERAKFYEAVFSSYTKILTVSDFIKERTSAFFPTSKIQTVYNGIDLKKFSPKWETTVNRKELGFPPARNTLGLGDQDFVLIYSGRINEEKGIMQLIEAIRLLKNYPAIKLLVIGSSFFGNTTNENGFIKKLKELAEPLGDRIIFTGFVPYNKMPDYLSMADTAVIPSVWDDPFPTTVLEAQAMGLPIISTRRGGIPEEVTAESAILLTTDNYFVKNLAQAILDLYHHPEKRKVMSQAALNRSKLFSKERYAQEFFEALTHIERTSV